MANPHEKPNMGHGQVAPSRTFKVGLILVVLGVVSLSATAFLAATLLWKQDAKAPAPSANEPHPLPHPDVLASKTKGDGEGTGDPSNANGTPGEPDTSDTSGAPGATAVAYEPARRYLAAAGRSPYPNAGETITEPMKPRRLASGEAAAPPAPGEVLPWHRAGNHIGQTITIEGKIVAAHNTGKVVFLNFHKDWRGKFYLVLFSDAIEQINAKHGVTPDKYFLGKTIRLRGKVSSRSGSPQMQVRKADRIEVITLSP